MDNLTPIVSGLLGAILGYFLAYINEKAKNKALKEDIAGITAKKEPVLANSRLQHEKRTHQYERKHSVYSLYHNLLDRFDSENAIVNPDKTEPLMSELVNALYLHRDNETEKIQAINHFGDTLSKMVRDALVGLKEISVKTNEIKLVATDEINIVLDKLKANYKKIGDISELAFKDKLAVVQGTVDFEVINDEMKKLSSSTDELRAECIRLMRKDLNNI